jgi:arylsulfatase A
MKSSGRFGFTHPVRLLCVVALLVFGLTTSAGYGATPSRPNIVLIMADDLGFETIGCYGGTSYQTPHIDALAASGIRFNRAYATPLCSPSRVQLMTGRYGFRTGWTNLIGRGGEEAKFYFDPTKETTFGHMLKKAGYATALAGKWQLAEFMKNPDHVATCGFDEYCCWAWELDGKRTSRYWDPSIWQNGKLRIASGKYGEDIFTDFLSDFMRRHKEEPFFVYYPMVLVHEPHTPTPDSASKEQKKKGDRKKEQGEGKTPPEFVDMMAYMDKAVGRIVKTLDELKLRENTLIIFTGDNGTGRSVWSKCNGMDIKGGKGTVTEFGTHVPFIASWKQTIPAGRVLEDLIDFSDVFPTLAEVGRAELPKGVTLDGHSFAAQLRGEKGKPRDWIYCQLGDERFVRDNRYLLHGNGRMYEVDKDPFEKEDVSGRDGVKSARERLEKILKGLRP